MKSKLILPIHQMDDEGAAVRMGSMNQNPLLEPDIIAKKSGLVVHSDKKPSV